MIVTRGRKFRLYPTPEQKRMFNRIFGACNLVYNRFVAENVRRFEERPIIDPEKKDQGDKKKKKKKSKFRNKIGCSISQLDHKFIYAAIKAEAKRDRAASSEDGIGWILDVPLTYLSDAHRTFHLAWRHYKIMRKNGHDVEEPTFRKRRHRSFGFHGNFCVTAKDGTTLYWSHDQKKSHNPVAKPYYFLHNQKLIGPIRGIFPKGSFDHVVDFLSFCISQRADRYFLSIQVKEHLPDPVFAGPRVGIDRGLLTFAVTSDGVDCEEHHLPKEKIRHLECKIDQLTRKQARQQTTCPKCGHRNRKPMKKGQRAWNCPACETHVKPRRSKRLRETKIKIGRLYLQIDNVRAAFHHNLSRRLAEENGSLVVETLDVAGMAARAKAKQTCPKCGYRRTEARVPGWECPKCGAKINAKKHNKMSRSIYRQGWSEFERQLTYKGKWYGCEIVKADRFFPSSKICSACGFKRGKMSLSEREWTCSECGATHDRDHNAATNLAGYKSCDH